MRVFVAYGYLPAEEWVRHYVVPILQTLDIEVVDGREIPGERITDAVVRRIEGVDALIGFLLRRQKLPGNKAWTASQWVELRDPPGAPPPETGDPGHGGGGAGPGRRASGVPEACV